MCTGYYVHGPDVFKLGGTGYYVHGPEVFKLGGQYRYYVHSIISLNSVKLEHGSLVWEGVDIY